MLCCVSESTFDALRLDMSDIKGLPAFIFFHGDGSYSLLPEPDRDYEVVTAR